MAKDDITDVNRRSVLKTAGALGAFFGVSGVVSATPGREPGPKKDEVLVGVSDSLSNTEAEVEKALPSNAEIVHRNETLGYVAVEFPSDASSQGRERFKENVIQSRDVEYAEDNETLEALFVPNDPQYDDQYAPQQVNAEGAWETTLGDGDVVISVVDQGIQYDHPNLEENMDDSVSDYGENFAGTGSDPYPVNESEDHGTHVGGIAAGGTDNGEGHAGISNCSMLSARALDESGGGSISDIADAIQWSADQGADVINMSLGGGSSTTLENACDYAEGEGSLLVAAAGNDFGGSVGYPAAYDAVMAVSSLDEGETLSNFSSTGPEVELAAPGGDVLSAVNFDDYDTMSGTSMASPVVAGVAGLALSAHPDLSNDELRSHLQNTAVELDNLSDNEQGYGRVDADNAVNTDPDDDPGDPGDPGDPDDPDEEVTSISDSLSSGESDCWTYSWEFSDPSDVVIELEGPGDATFDLYANEGRSFCPTTSDYDHVSYTWGSDEEIDIDNPDTSTDLYILVDAWSGSGDYDLTVTETSG